jgi:Mn2+/Fe2+ NRAMP family transporter
MMSEASFLAVVSLRYGRWLSVLLGLSALLITTGFQTGDNVGVGIAMAELFGGTMAGWAIAFTVVALALLWGSRSIYQAIEKIMVALVVVMIGAFLGNMLMIRPDGGDVLRGLVPSQPAVFAMVVALSSTTFSIAAAAFQPYLVQSKGWKKEDVSKGLKDSFIGIFTLCFITCVIMVTSATVLRPLGIKVKDAIEMARQLEPLLGSFAKWLFLLGFWAASFSSFVVNAMVGGTLMSDGLGLGGRLDSFWSKALASLIMALGTVLAIRFGDNPVQLIVTAQATTALTAPVMALVMWLLTMNRAFMEAHRNRPVVNVLAAAAIGWLLFLSVRQGLAFLGVV